MSPQGLGAGRNQVPEVAGVSNLGRRTAKQSRMAKKGEGDKWLVRGTGPTGLTYPMAWDGLPPMATHQATEVNLWSVVPPWGCSDQVSRETGKAGENGQSSDSSGRGFWIRPSVPHMFCIVFVCWGIAIDWVTSRSTGGTRPSSRAIVWVLCCQVVAPQVTEKRPVPLRAQCTVRPW